MGIFNAQTFRRLLVVSGVAGTSIEGDEILKGFRTKYYLLWLQKTQNFLFKDRIVSSAVKKRE